MSQKIPGPDRPAVFVSYSHLDKRWKERLVRQLRVLEPEGVLEVWDDRQISPGTDWLPEIEQAMRRAVAAVLLISADFLTSEFILGQEVPRLLERRRSEGLLVLPGRSPGGSRTRGSPPCSRAWPRATRASASSPPGSGSRTWRDSRRPHPRWIWRL